MLSCHSFRLDLPGDVAKTYRASEAQSQGCRKEAAKEGVLGCKGARGSVDGVFELCDGLVFGARNFQRNRIRLVGPPL